MLLPLEAAFGPALIQTQRPTDIGGGSWGLGFRVAGFRAVGFGVLGFRGVGYRVQGCRVWGLGG